MEQTATASPQAERSVRLVSAPHPAGLRRRAPRAARWVLARSLTIAAGAAAAIPVIVSTVNAARSGWEPAADRAIIVTRAWDVFTSHTPLVGQYSEASGITGYALHSPGPMLYWLLAIPARFGGPVSLEVTMGVVNALAILAIVALARRRGGLVLMFATAAAIALMCQSLPAETFHDMWNPSAGLFPFLLLIFLCWSVACGDHRLLPAVALVASYVAQVHLMYVLPTLGLLVVACCGLATERLAFAAPAWRARARALRAAWSGRGRRDRDVGSPVLLPPMQGGAVPAAITAPADIAATRPAPPARRGRPGGSPRRVAAPTSLLFAALLVGLLGRFAAQLTFVGGARAAQRPRRRATTRVAAMPSRAPVAAPARAAVAAVGPLPAAGAPPAAVVPLPAAGPPPAAVVPWPATAPAPEAVVPALAAVVPALAAVVPAPDTAPAPGAPAPELPPAPAPPLALRIVPPPGTAAVAPRPLVERHPPVEPGRRRSSVVVWLVVAVLIGLVCWTPPIVDQLADHPGNLGLIAQTATRAEPTVGAAVGWRAVVRSVGVRPWWLYVPGSRWDRKLDVRAVPSTLARDSTIAILAALALAGLLGLLRRRRDLTAAALIAFVLCAALAVNAAETPTIPVMAATLGYTLWWGSLLGMWTWLVLAWSAWLAAVWLARPLVRHLHRRLAARRPHVPSWAPAAAAVPAVVLALGGTAAIGKTVAATEQPDEHQQEYRPIAAIAAQLDALIPAGQTIDLTSGRLDWATMPIKPAVRYFLVRHGDRVLAKGSDARLGSWYDLGRRPYGWVVNVSDGRRAPSSGFTLAVRVHYVDGWGPETLSVWTARRRPSAVGLRERQREARRRARLRRERARERARR